MNEQAFKYIFSPHLHSGVFVVVAFSLFVCFNREKAFNSAISEKKEVKWNGKMEVKFRNPN